MTYSHQELLKGAVILRGVSKGPFSVVLQEQLRSLQWYLVRVERPVPAS